MLSWDDPVPMTSAPGPLPQARKPQPSPVAPMLAERVASTPDERPIAPAAVAHAPTGSQVARSDRRVRVEDKRIISDDAKSAHRKRESRRRFARATWRE